MFRTVIDQIATYASYPVRGFWLTLKCVDCRSAAVQCRTTYHTDQIATYASYPVRAFGSH